MSSLRQLESDQPPAAMGKRQPPLWARSDIWLTATLGLVFAAIEIVWLAAIVLGATLLAR